VWCGEVVQLDTAILQILLALQRELQSRGKDFRLEGLSVGLRELLELAGVNDMFVGPAAEPSAQ
jgi:anti-anti-sigma regulatory factor